MKIAVNTRLLIENKLDGIGWFTYEALKRITTIHKEHQFYFFFDRKYSEQFIFSNNITPIILRPQARHPFLWYVWFEFSVKRMLDKIKPDLFLSPDGYLSLTSKIPSVPVIHDINFVHRPQDLPYFGRKFYNRYFPKYAEKANRIATVSEFSKHDIATQFNVPEEKISVVYNGCNVLYKPVNKTIKTKIKAEYSACKDYFIFIGTMHPRKNLSRLFEAFERYKTETGSDFKLIIVGTKMFMTSDLEETYNHSAVKEDIIFTGRLSPEKLHHVLASAFALTFVPLFEGFGIPLIEAMNCEVPIICSDTTSLPEVAGDAALYADPFSIDSVKNALVKITNDTNLRKLLIEKGNIRKTLFSWDKTAEKLWSVVESCL